MPSIIKDSSGKKFKVGQICKVQPGTLVKNPYYVAITSIDKDHVGTSIPGHHSASWPLCDWESGKYKNRMQIVGTLKTSSNLLENQKLD